MNDIEKFTGIRLDGTRRNRNRNRIWMIGIGVLLVVVLFSVFFFSKTVTAQREGDRVKLITSVEVKKGDTLWSIATVYMTEEYNDINDYIKEIKSCNGLATDNINAGNYIIVPYYADAGI